MRCAFAAVRCAVSPRWEGYAVEVEAPVAIDATGAGAIWRAAQGRWNRTRPWKCLRGLTHWVEAAEPGTEKRCGAGL